MEKVGGHCALERVGGHCALERIEGHCTLERVESHCALKRVRGQCDLEKGWRSLRAGEGWRSLRHAVFCPPLLLLIWWIEGERRWRLLVGGVQMYSEEGSAQTVVRRRERCGRSNLLSVLLLLHRLVGLVVKVSASRAEGPGFESRLRRDFFGVESYQ